MFEIRNHFQSPSSGMHMLEQMWMFCPWSLHDELCPSSAPLWLHVTNYSLKPSDMLVFSGEGGLI